MSKIQIVYDGECPFCSRYVTMTRLRQSVGDVELVDARSDHPIVSEIKSLGFDLNQGMVARFNGVDYYGSECLHLISMLSSKVGWLSRLATLVFSSRRRARLAYPVLRAGRNLTLRLLGRSRIE